MDLVGVSDRGARKPLEAIVAVEADRPSPICTSQGQTSSGGAVIVIACVCWSASATNSSPGSGRALSSDDDPQRSIHGRAAVAASA